MHLFESRRLFDIAALALVAANLQCEKRADVRPEANQGSSASELSKTGSGEESTAPQSGTAQEPRGVRLVPVVTHDFADVITVSGTLAPDERVVLSTKAAGRLAVLEVDLASEVKAGGLVARIETRDYEIGAQQARAALGQARALLGLEPGANVAQQNPDSVASVQQAQATLHEAELNVTRLESLAQEGLAPLAELDAARASLLRARASLEAAREQVRGWRALIRQRASDVALAEQRLQDTRLYSPFDGFVQAKLANVGQYLPTGAPVLEVVKVDPLRLQLSIVERDAPRVQVGQRVQVRGTALEQQLEGKVARIAPALDPTTRTLLLEVDIANPGRLRPGTFVDAKIHVGVRTQPSVPSSALVSFAGLQKVLLVEDETVVERVVQVGERVDDKVELLSGVQAGQAVIDEPGSLQQGQRVKPMHEAPHGQELRP
jgi:RND family efflux transporter MFP subunit